LKVAKSPILINLLHMHLVPLWLIPLEFRKKSLVKSRLLVHYSVALFA